MKNTIKYDKDVEQRAAAVATALDRVEALAEEYQMTPPGEAFVRARAALAKRDFAVTVCGEVKQGKSSLVNALLGSDMMPVSEKVATSQAFHVIRGRRPACSLVLADGRRIAVPATELARYGTEEGQVPENDSRLQGGTLDHVEVLTTARFLPNGVRLIDTPGLGALYAAHEQVALRSLAQADAVVFVKDATSPLRETEKAFLRRIDKQTPNLICVLTKWDLVDIEARASVLEENARAFAEVLGDRPNRPLEILPVSSRLLSAAAEEKDEDERSQLVEASGFDALFSSLGVLLGRTLGLMGIEAAEAELVAYCGRLENERREQEALLRSESPDERAAIVARKNALIERFARDWGRTGVRQHAFAESSAQITRSAMGVIQALFAPGSTLRNDLLREIDSLPDDTVVLKNYVKQIPSHVSDVVAEKINTVLRETRERLLREVVVQDEQIDLGRQEMKPVRASAGAGVLPSTSRFSKVRNIFYGGVFGSMVANTVFGSLSMMGTVILPVTIALGVAGCYLDQQRNEEKSLRSKLMALVQGAVNELQSSYLSSTHVGERSPVEESLAEMQERIVATGRRLAEEEKSRLDAEVRKLDAVLSLDPEAAAARRLRLGGLGDELNEAVRKVRSAAGMPIAA